MMSLISHYWRVLFFGKNAPIYPEKTSKPAVSTRITKDKIHANPEKLYNICRESTYTDEYDNNNIETLCDHA